MAFFGAGLEVSLEAAVFGEFLSEVFFYLSVILGHVGLGPNQEQYQIFSAIFLELSEPHFRRLDRLLVCNIYEQQAHLRLLVKLISYLHKVHVSGEVPELNLNRLCGIFRAFAIINKEVWANSLLILFWKFLVAKLIEKLSLANLGVAYYANFVTGGLFGDFGLEAGVGSGDHFIFLFINFIKLLFQIVDEKLFFFNIWIQ